MKPSLRSAVSRTLAAVRRVLGHTMLVLSVVAMVIGIATDSLSASLVHSGYFPA